MGKYIANPVEVNAFVITEVAEPLEDGSRWIVMDGNPNCLASSEMLSRITPVLGDYWVIQSDGYVYLNPKEVFERKYRRIDGPRPTIEDLEKILNSEGEQRLTVHADGSVTAEVPNASE